MAAAAGTRLDLIHAHTMVQAYQVAPIARLCRIPMIFTFHGLPPEGVGLLAPDKRRYLFDTCNRVTVNTIFAGRQVIALGCPESKVIVLPQGVPISELPFTEKAFDPQNR